MDGVDVSVMEWSSTLVNVSPCTRPSCVRNSHMCIKADVFLRAQQKVNFILLEHEVMRRKMIDVFLKGVQMMMMFMPLNVSFFMSLALNNSELQFSFASTPCHSHWFLPFFSNPTICPFPFPCVSGLFFPPSVSISSKLPTFRSFNEVLVFSNSLMAFAPSSPIWFPVISFLSCHSSFKVQSKRASKLQRCKAFNEVICFSVLQSLFTPSELIPHSVFHSSSNGNVFSNNCDEFLTLKFKCDKSSVHNQSTAQCLHSFITNLVGCSFHLHSECLHFGTSFTTHFQSTTLSWLCVFSAFHSVPLHLQSQMRFLLEIMSINHVFHSFLFL